uniref:PSD13 N-terminal domain-containing protein n=1 Tax=Oryctolagus cuniculus TaxID=9986 RepID=A0A5F9CG41_RABIT
RQRRQGHGHRPALHQLKEASSRPGRWPFQKHRAGHAVGVRPGVRLSPLHAAADSVRRHCHSETLSSAPGQAPGRHGGEGGAVPTPGAPDVPTWSPRPRSPPESWGAHEGTRQGRPWQDRRGLLRQNRTRSLRNVHTRSARDRSLRNVHARSARDRSLRNVHARLWHQLTLQVLDFVQDPCFAQGDGLIKLYENFISEFEHRVNPLSLVEIILHVVRQMTDPNVALTFLEKTREKVKSSDEAVILCKTAIGALKLNIGDLQVTKETIEDVEEMLSNLPGVTSVHSRFYDLSSKYYQTTGNHASYYKDALRFLGCVDIKDLPGDSGVRARAPRSVFCRQRTEGLRLWVSEITQGLIPC